MVNRFFVPFPLLAITLVSFAIGQSKNKVFETVNGARDTMTVFTPYGAPIIWPFDVPKSLAPASICPLCPTLSKTIVDEDSAAENSRVGNLERDLLVAKSEIAILLSQVASLLENPVIFFNAYRTTPFTSDRSIITYDVLSVNEGGAMDASTGIFKAPLNGFYEFNFHAISNWGTRPNDHTRVRLMVNNVGKTMSHGDQTHTHTLSFSMIIELKAGDLVNCYLITGGMLYDTPTEMMTQFTGKLLKNKK